MSATGGRPGIPVYLRILGGAMLLWGVLGLQLLRNSDTATGWWWALAIVFVVGGSMLLLGRRLGWPLALLEAIGNLGMRIFEVLSRRADPVIATFILQIVPSCLALWALCTPRSLAWLRASPRRAEA